MSHQREIQLDVVTPSGVVFSEPVEYLSVVGPEGSIGILPNHVPVFMLVDIGVLEYQKNGVRDFITTMGGILEFHNNHASVVTEASERSSDIDELRVKESMKKAQAKLSEKAGVAVSEKADSLAALQRASVRLRTLELLKNRHNRRKI
jgi:F-type H+-transporting ATPase subunit epsilon